MSLLAFQREIENQTRKKLKLKINDNSATMLSVRWEHKCTRVSMHRMFLFAPKNIMDKLSCYIKRKEKTIAPEVKAYIAKNLKNLNYSHRRNKIFTQGNIYNLKKMYNAINAEYFNNKLDLHITWYGKPSTHYKNNITLGVYKSSLKLIKVHRLLDNISVPDYVLSYVIYHEILHNLYPPYYDKKGINRIHNDEFKKREQQFRHYNLAKEWILECQPTLFGD